MKERKKAVILSFVVIFLPTLIGLLLWDALPASIATHWNFHGQADGFSSRPFALVGIPLFMAALQLLCLVFTYFDRSNKHQNEKIVKLIIWIVPAISALVGVLILSAALGSHYLLPLLPFILTGILFIIIGNYMPKCKQNRTIGIKLKWTLESEANWNATHRYAGKLWVIGGIALLLCILLPQNWAPWLLLAVITLMVLLPTLYSYRFSRKNQDNDTTLPPLSKQAKWIGGGILALILVLLGVLLFTGEIRYEDQDDKFYIEASYWGDRSLYYGDMEKIIYLERHDPGMRTMGFGSFRLSMGNFYNDAYGNYYRYTYNSCDSCILIVTEDSGTLLINDKTEAQTKALYSFLCGKVS